MSGSPLPTGQVLEAVSAKPPKQAPAARDKAGDSAFDAVSRQEQKRLEQRDAAQRNAAQRDASRRSEELRAEKSQRPDGKERPEPADASARPQRPENRDKVETKGSAENSGKPASASSGNTTEPEHDVSVAPGQSGSGAALDETGLLQQDLTDPAVLFTFADLQAMVTNGSSQILAPGTAAGTGAAAQLGLAQDGKSGILAMAAELAGLKGQAKGAGPTESGTRLVDTLMGQITADSGKPVELTTVARFQGALDVANQQLAPSGQKIPEAMIPLKGYATSVELPVGHAEWGDKLMGKLAWLTTQKMSVAEIHLTPPDMGPLDVRVQVQNDQASVTIHATNSAVRDQLELHSHRLRDMLNGQGLDLESFDVASSPDRENAGDGDQQQGNGGRGGDESLNGDLDMAEASGGALDLGWRGEVDLYA